MKSSKGTAAELKSIVRTASEDNDFKTFIKAINAAGLEKVLRSETPITVFAPTEEAFNSLPKEKLEALFENTGELTNVLVYHMVPGRLLIKDIIDLNSADTVEGDKLVFYPCNGVKINGADIVKADIECSNGIIHGIDRVLFPK